MIVDSGDDISTTVQDDIEVVADGDLIVTVKGQ